MKEVNSITENLLYYVWKYQKFYQKNLFTSDREPLVILSPGFQNEDSGPDFRESRIKIGTMEWFGNVEIHVKASDWKKHHHEKDAAFQNIILHVVWDNDLAVTIKESPVPTLELCDLVDHQFLKEYESFLSTDIDIPCKKLITSVPKIILDNQMDKVLIERLFLKSKNVDATLKTNQNNWTETYYQTIAANLGFSLNREPFAQLASMVPFRLLKKYQQSLKILEALLFGVAGLLSEDKDEYAQELKREFDFYAQKHTLSSMNSAQWKFAKARPRNFPTVRIAQLALFVHSDSLNFNKTIENLSIVDLIKSFHIHMNGYWSEHYDFGKTSKTKAKKLSKQTYENLLINTVVPTLVSYSRYSGEEKFTDRAIELLQEISPESNRITKKWESIGIKPRSAFESQALIQQYKNYCSPKKCLSCSVGVNLLSQ